MCKLLDVPSVECSLAVVKPKEVLDIKTDFVGREWTGKQKAIMSQLWLGERKTRDLKKVPYTFKYHYKCAERECNGHTQTIFDWELGALYWKMEKKYGENTAVEKVVEKFYGDMCSSNKDTYFFVGTTKGYYHAWVVIGVFCPPKQPHQQASLPF